MTICSQALLTGSALLVSALAAAAQAETTAFSFTDPGTTYTGFIFPGDPRIGGHVYNARIYLDLEVLDGADAAQFDTDITLPLAPDKGSSQLVTFTGAELGWSGSGQFHHFVETKTYNGTFIGTIFGAASAPLDAFLLETARIELDYTPVPEPTALLGVATFGMGLQKRRRRSTRNP
jgi:hypothetical protein